MSRYGTTRPSNGTPKNGTDGQVPTTRPCTARPSKTRHGRVRRILADSGDARIPDSVRRIPGRSSTHLAPRQAEPSGLTDPSRFPRQPSWTNVGDLARENRETAISAVRCSGTLMEYTLAPGTVLPQQLISYSWLAVSAFLPCSSSVFSFHLRRILLLSYATMDTMDNMECLDDSGWCMSV